MIVPPLNCDLEHGRAGHCSFYIIQLVVAIQILWIIASGLVKLSILALYLRIFNVLKYIRLGAWTLIILDLIWLISVTVAHGLECTPVAKIWDNNLPGHCLNTVALFMIGSIIDVVMDFLILLLPLPAIMRLQMGLHKKISLVVIFALGGLYVDYTVALLSLTLPIMN